MEVDAVHVERAKALQEYAKSNGMKVLTLREIVQQADRAGRGNRTQGFDWLDNWAQFIF